MAVFNTYPKLDVLTGEEVFVLADSTGTRTVTATVAQVIEAPVSVEASGQFYSDKGAQVKRFADRLLVGVAAENPALSDRASSSQNDWLSETMAATSIGPWALQDAQCASVAQFGNSAFVAGSRTSDALSGSSVLGFQPSSIGVASWGISDDTSNPTTTTAYAYYGEAWRMAVWIISLLSGWSLRRSISVVLPSDSRRLMRRMSVVACTGSSLVQVVGRHPEPRCRGGDGFCIQSEFLADGHCLWGAIPDGDGWERFRIRIGCLIGPQSCC